VKLCLAGQTYMCKKTKRTNRVWQMMKVTPTDP
jgi:hypothetical protein